MPIDSQEDGVNARDERTSSLWMRVAVKTFVDYLLPGGVDSPETLGRAFDLIEGCVSPPARKHA